MSTQQFGFVCETILSDRVPSAYTLPQVFCDLMREIQCRKLDATKQNDVGKKKKKSKKKEKFLKLYPDRVNFVRFKFK